jgi:hypothetical protein
LSEGQFVIALRPTRRKEIVNGVEFRVFVGRTNTGIDVEMLGLFRVMGDIEKHEEFQRAVCAVDPGDPPVTLLSGAALVNP